MTQEDAERVLAALDAYIELREARLRWGDGHGRGLFVVPSHSPIQKRADDARQNLINALVVEVPGKFGVGR